MSNNPIRDMVSRVITKEGKKHSMHIANGLEFTRILNQELGGELYAMIKNKGKPKPGVVVLRAVFWAMVLLFVISLMSWSLINLSRTFGYQQAAQDFDSERKSYHQKYRAVCNAITTKAYDDGRLNGHDAMRYYMIAEGIKVGKRVMETKCDCSED